MGRSLQSREFRPVILLIGVMIVLVAAASSVAVGVLYSAVMEDQRVRLTQVLESEAHLIEETVRPLTSGRAATRWRETAGLPPLVRSHLEGHHLGETGEFTLARREGDQIVFLHERRFEDAGATSYPITTAMAEPMRRALQGDTGTLVGLDYRGETVLAAYRPLPELGLGLVAKIDIAELREPFATAILAGSVATLVVILAGAIVFLRIGGPLASRLKASEQRFRTLVDTLPYGVQEIDANGIIQFANMAVHRLRGVDDGTVVGRSVVEFVATPEGRERLRLDLARFFAEQPEPTPYVTTIRGDDGKTRDIRIDWTYRRSPTGQVTGFVSVVTDVTEELRAHAELSRYQEDLESVVGERTRELALSELRFRAVAETANDAIITLDRAGRIVYSNRKAEQIFGYPADGITDTPFSHLLSHGGSTSEWSAIAAPGETVELMGKRADGSRVPLEVSFAEWSDGDNVFHTGILRDIGDRKQAEAEIRRAKARFESVLNNIDATVYVVDLRSHEILYVNGQSKAQFGDVVGKTCWQSLKGKTDGPCDGCAIPRLLDQDGRPNGVQVSEHYETTTGRWLECRDQAVYWTDGRLVLMQIATDVTERKRHEVELQERNDRIAQQADELKSLAWRLDAARCDAEEASRQAQAANQAKSAFLAAMSHELRTPLNSILGFSEVIRDEIFGPLGTHRYADYASDIHTSGRHLLDLINDVLDLSKIEAGKLDLALEPVDVRQLLQSCSKLVRERAQQQGLALLLETEPMLPEITADERAVKQIVLNLLSNALKFTDRGGEVILRADRTPANGVRITVADSGCGIPSDRLERVLQPFEQADNAYARASGGTGLGLALVKSFAELHGGSIAITSTVGVGTVVNVTLPRQPDGLRAPTELHAPEIPQVPQRVHRPRSNAAVH